MPRLSIVIPVLGDLKRLEDTLVSVLENRPDDCQVLVVPNELYDDPYDLKDEVCFVQAPPGAGLVTSANLGICASRAPIVHLLACGMEVSPGWADAALARFDNPRVGAVAPVILEKEDQGRVVAAGLGYSPAGVPRQLGRGRSPAEAMTLHDALCGPDPLAAFYRKTALESVGQFSRKVGDRLAGIDLALKLRRVGFRAVVEPECRTCLSAGLPANQASFSAGLEAERLFWRWAPQYGWLRSLASHAALLAGECLQGFARPAVIAKLAGRLVGGLQLRTHRRHWRAIRRQARAVTSAVARPHFANANQPTATSSTSAIGSAAGGSPALGSAARSSLMLPCSNGPAAPRRLPG